MDPTLNDDALAMLHDNRPLAESAGTEADGDDQAAIDRGGQAIEALGNDLAAAASGHMRDVDMDSARQRLRDVQTALVALGFSLDDDRDPVAHIEQGDSRALTEAVRQFQDEQDLEVSGRIDRDTYETLMRQFEQGLSMQAQTPVQDDFGYLHANEALDVPAGEAASDDELALDEGSQALLNLDADDDASDLGALEDL